MLIREAKRKLINAGYIVIKEDNTAEENELMFWRKPNKLAKKFTGIKNNDTDIDEMSFEDFYSIVSGKINNMCKLYGFTSKAEDVEDMIREYYENGKSIKETFKDVWYELSKI